MRRQPRIAVVRRAHPGKFWLGAGMGLVLSAAAVVIAAEFTFLRRQRLLATGSLHLTEDELVHDLSEAVHEGLGVLSHAAQQIGHSFAEARRELIRFGLDPLHGGGGDAAYYYDDEEHQRADSDRPAPDFESEWEG